MATGYEVYDYKTLLGTVRLLNGKLDVRGPQAMELRNLLDKLRKWQRLPDDAAVFAKLPQIARGVLHLNAIP